MGVRALGRARGVCARGWAGVVACVAESLAPCAIAFRGLCLLRPSCAKGTLFRLCSPHGTSARRRRFGTGSTTWLGAGRHMDNNTQYGARLQLGWGAKLNMTRLPPVAVMDARGLLGRPCVALPTRIMVLSTRPNFGVRGPQLTAVRKQMRRRTLAACTPTRYPSSNAWDPPYELYEKDSRMQHGIHRMHPDPPCLSNGTPMSKSDLGAQP